MKINSVKKNFAGLVAMAVTIATVQLVSAQSNVFNVFNYQGALQVTNNSGGLEPAPDGPYTCYCWPFWWHCGCPIPVPWNCGDCPVFEFTNVINEYPSEVSLDQLQVSAITLRQEVFTMPFSVDQAFLNSNINSGTLCVRLWVIMN